MPMTAREAIRRLKRDGWVEERQSGSHKIFTKDNRLIVVPDHKGDLKPGVEKDIKKKGWMERLRSIHPAHLLTSQQTEEESL